MAKKKQTKADIRIVGDIDDERYDKFLKDIFDLESSVEEITIHLTTDGGEVTVGFGFYDYIKYLQSQGIVVTVIAEGKCMSAGIMILLASEVRAAMPNASLLVHYGWQMSDSEDTQEFHYNLTGKLKKLIALETGMSTKKVNGWFKRETYFDVEKATKNGLLNAEIK